GVVEQPGHPQIVEFAFELRWSEPGIERGRGGAERPDREEGGDQGGAAGGEDRHPVAGAQAQAGEAPRRPVERALQRGVRDEGGGLGYDERGMVIGPLDEGSNRGAFSEGHDAGPPLSGPAAAERIVTPPAAGTHRWRAVDRGDSDTLHLVSIEEDRWS